MAVEAEPLSNLPELVPAAVFMEDVNAYMKGAGANRQLPIAADCGCRHCCRCALPTRRRPHRPPSSFLAHAPPWQGAPLRRC